MAKDQTVVGITGKPVPKPGSAKKQYELEKKRRQEKHLGKNVGGTQYKSDVNPYYNPRQRTFEEFMSISESIREEYELDEVRGFGGHIDPQTGKSTGKRSKSQQAHSQYWNSRRESGKDTPDPRRSKFKYGGAKKSTTGAHEGDTPEGFAKKQNPDLAMTPSARMKARAKSLELKGKGKQANKIRAVASRPNMSEG